MNPQISLYSRAKNTFTNSYTHIYKQTVLLYFKVHICVSYNLLKV